MMSFPLAVHPNLIHTRPGRIITGLGKTIRRRKMRGGNIMSTLGKSALNIITSGNKKATALNELKNLNSTLRQGRVISNFLKNRQGVLGKIGSVASLAGYGRRRRRKRRMRGGNIASTLGRSALNILTSGNKKQAALNELKNLNSTLRQGRVISNFLKDKKGVLGKIGTVAGLAGYGRRRTYRRRLRGGSFFGKIWSGIKSAGKFAGNVIKKPVKLATKVVQAPVKLVMDTVGQPIINYGVSKLLGGRRRRYKRRQIVRRPIRSIYAVRTRRRKQRGGFLLAPIIAGLVKRTGSTLINKGKEKLINYAKSQGENLLKKITGGRRRRRTYRRKRRY